MNFRNLFPFGKNKEPEENITGEDDDFQTVTLSMPDIYRNLLYDSAMDDVEKIMPLLGFPSQSPEVSEMSMRASNERVMALEPIGSVISLLVNSLNGALNVYLRQQVAEQEIPGLNDEVIDAMIEAHDEMLLDNVTAIISNLLHLGFIQLGEYYVAGVTTRSPERNNEE